MKTKFIFLASFYLLASATIAEASAPARDYKTINFDNGITSRVLEVGSTSVTFSVEWSLDIAIPANLMVIGKLNMVWKSWSFWGEVDVAQNQGRTTVEYLYAQFPPLEPAATRFAQKAFFSIQMPIRSEEEWDTTWGADGWATNGVVEPPLNAPTVEAQQDEGRAQASSPSREKKIGTRNTAVTDTDDEENQREKASHLWLYVGIILVIGAGFYFLRKRFARN